MKKVLEHPHDNGSEMSVKHFEQIKHHIDEAMSRLRSMGDLPDWLETKIAQAADDIIEASHYIAIDSEHEMEKSVSELQDADELVKRCWEGYEPAPGKEPFSRGSCVKKSRELLKAYQSSGKWKVPGEVPNSAELAKGPYLRQGSKLGQELYDDKQNIERKRTRTGQEATGAGIRAEQLWGGKAGYRTAKQQAAEQEKKDKARSKKNPVKTLDDLSPEEKQALEAKYGTAVAKK